MSLRSSDTARHIASPLPRTGPTSGSSSASCADRRRRPRGDRGGAVARGRVDDDDLVDHARSRSCASVRDDRADRRGALARRQADGDGLGPLRGDALGGIERMMERAGCAQRSASDSVIAALLSQAMAATSPAEPWSALLQAGREDERLVPEAAGPGRGRLVDVPDELHPAVRAALARTGIERLYAHQREAVFDTWAGPTIVTTGTASGKSLCFNLPTLDVLCRTRRPGRSTCTRRRRSRRTRRAPCRASDSTSRSAPRSTTAIRRARRARRSDAARTSC